MRERRPRRPTIITGLLILAIAGIATTAILLSGYGIASDSEDNGQLLYPVRGEIFINEKPAKGVLVFFEAVSPSGNRHGRLRARGMTDANGGYTIHTYSAGDGLPAGKYNIKLRAGIMICTWGPSESPLMDRFVDRLEDEFSDGRKNAESDAQFAVEVQDSDPKRAPQKVPRISLKIDGWESE
jgi:hypothetical protein